MASQANQLQNLKISAYSNVERNKLIGTFNAMFNPESMQQQESVLYSRRQGINTSGQTQVYNSSPPTVISFKLLLSSFCLMNLDFMKKRSSIADEVKSFQELTYGYNGEIHQPNFLTINWGELNFNCRLQSLNIDYSLFDSQGNPINVELDCSFIGDEPSSTLLKKENKQSPDMTHIREINPANSLTLIAADLYGDTSYYLALARFNNINHFRNIPYGRKIICPPLEQLL